MKELKSISEIRKGHGLNVRECASSLKYIKSKDIDFDVFLPSIGKNLQRHLVWDIKQKREIVLSVIYGRHIPHISYINSIKVIDGKLSDSEIWQIIDGKQRLTSLFSFIDDKFTIILEGEEFLFSELPNDYKLGILSFHIRKYEVVEDVVNSIKDSEKIIWFKSINFSGTIQEETHMNLLK
jgi:uncharacterized protein with ParB-like and HNH nuclease domain